MAASNYSLNVNRQLLDPSFESYRLSLDPIPTYTIELDAAVAEVKLRDSQYTLDHVRAFGMYNYLHGDPWHQDSVYFVDCKGRVLNLTVMLPLFSRDLGDPFIILHSVAYVMGGTLYVDVLLLRVQPDPTDTTGSGFSVSLEWLTLAGESGQGQERVYEVRRTRTLHGKSVPHYAAVEPRGRGLMLASEKPFRFTHVDGRPLEDPVPETMEVEEKAGQ